MTNSYVVDSTNPYITGIYILLYSAWGVGGNSSKHGVTLFTGKLCNVSPHKWLNLEVERGVSPKWEGGAGGVNNEKVPNVRQKNA